MKNLKKTLAVVLAFAMILSMGFSAFAYTDVAEGTKVAEAVGVLSNLNIFTGFEDGTFKPNDTVTRAQMAAIICRTLGYEDQAQASTGTTNFYDVPASHWASGYINVAESLQIVNGYGNGAFGPEDQVTYEQAIKMIVVALGYELDAQAKGGWSTGYLAVAAREGITKNSNGVVGTPAARGTIAVLVYNSLEVRLMDQDTWTTSGKEDEYKKLNETVLSKYLGVQKWEGVVAKTPYAQHVSTYNPDTTPVVELAPGCFYEEWRSGKLTKIYPTTTTTDGAGNTITVNDGLYNIDASLVDVNPYAGKKVVAYVGAEADERTGHRMVYAITEKIGANTVTTIGLNQLVTEGKYFAETGVIGYKEVGSSRAIDIELDTAVTLVKNFDTQSVATTAIDTTQELASVINAANGTISFISNDNDNKVDVILVTAYTDEAVVEEVVTEDGIITLDFYSGSAVGSNGVISDIDVEDEDYLIIVYKDGALASVEDIAVNDTISAVYVNNKFNVLYVSSKTITGAVEGYDAETVTIAGEDYKVTSNYTNPGALKDKEGIFFLNVAGQIAHDEAEANKGNYGIVIAAAAGSGVKGGYEVEIVLADGTAAVYPLSSKAVVKNAAGQVLKADGTTVATSTADLTAAKTDDTVNTILTGLMHGTAGHAKRSDIPNLFFEVKVKNGQIAELKEVTPGTAETAATEEFDAENLAYGNIDFSESTVIFSISEATTTTTDLEADDIRVGKVSDFFVDGEGGYSSIKPFDIEDGIAGAIVGYDLDTVVALDGEAMVITGAKDVVYGDEDAVKLIGFQNGKEVAYTLYDEDVTYEAKDFAKGDVILVGAPDAEGVISAYKSLYKFNDNGNTSAADDKFELGAAATADAVKRIKFYAGQVSYATGYEPSKTAFNLVGGSGEITMKESARYTLVDFSEGDIEVSRKTKGTGIFGSNTRYEVAAFARYYDNKLVDVIVYRWDATLTNSVYDNIIYQAAE